MDGMSIKLGKGYYKKLSLISKTWERCKSIGRGRSKSTSKSTDPLHHEQLDLGLTLRSKSWPGPRGQEENYKHRKKGRTVAPEGCFSVYVGPQMQRFVIKTEYVNHPLFKMLLEEAESEYGYCSNGPLALPCDVHVFCKVLMEIMDQEPTTTTTTTDHDQQTRQGCAFGKRSRSYHLLSPSPMLAINQF